jgi:hypothetical protein
LYINRQLRTTDSRTPASLLESFPRENFGPRTTAIGNFFSNTVDALNFESDDSDILAARFVPNNVSGFEITIHRVPLGRVMFYADGADHITALHQDERAVESIQQGS